MSDINIPTGGWRDGDAVVETTNIPGGLYLWRRAEDDWTHPDDKSGVQDSDINHAIEAGSVVYVHAPREDARPEPEDRSAGRWCETCQQHGSHHTDKHDEFRPEPVVAPLPNEALRRLAERGVGTDLNPTTSPSVDVGWWYEYLRALDGRWREEVTRIADRPVSEDDEDTVRERIATAIEAEPRTRENTWHDGFAAGLNTAARIARETR